MIIEKAWLWEVSAHHLHGHVGSFFTLAIYDEDWRLVAESGEFAIDKYREPRWEVWGLEELEKKLQAGWW